MLIRKYFKLTDPECKLLWRTAFLLAGVRAGLWLFPLSVLRHLMQRQFCRFVLPPELATMHEDRLAWAVTVASRAIPDASCLTQALALQHLLRQSGRQATVQIGVVLEADRKFKAHAWVEHAGQVLLDHPEEIVRYTRLYTLEAY